MPEDDRTYTQKEVEILAAQLKERQETLEALECARIVMIEQKQYPRFIARINHLIMSIEGVTPEEINEEEQEKVEKDEKGNTIVKVKPKK